MENGTALAVGMADATVQIWDVTRQKRMRTLRGHDSRVGSMCWNGALLTTGCKSGVILNNDVRVADAVIGSLEGHTQEVCGLKWSPDGRFLAR